MFLKLMVAGAAILVLSATSAGAAPNKADFSGRWMFSPTKSRNIGMMSGASILTTAAQSPTKLVVDDNSKFGGQNLAEHTVYDLTGAPSPNISQMTGASIATSHWDGDTLVTDWETDGAVPGSKVHRTETRRLSGDGLTMTLQSTRMGKEPMVMVFERR